MATAVVYYAGRVLIAVLNLVLLLADCPAAEDGKEIHVLLMSFLS
jgi:hypothetical protein